MDLQEVKTALDEYCADVFGDEYTVSIDDGALELKTGLQLKYYDDDIDVTVLVGEEGSFLLYMIFDSLEKTLDNYELMNTFNIEQPIFKAIINEDGRLELSHAALGIQSADSIIGKIDFVLSRIFEPDFIELLQPLTDRTV